MAANNLRIIYNNVANSATIACIPGPLGSTTTDNLKSDTKSLICRTAGTSVTYTITLAASSIVGGIILPFCNLTSTAVATVKFDSITVATDIALCPYQNLGLWDWGAIPLGSNGYAYGRGTYGRIWVPQTAVSVIELTITDTANTSGYLEFSRFVIGSYWAPTYNTSFGLSTTIKDLSTNFRSEAGDLITNRGTKSSSMTFDLNYMNPSDRLEMTSILRGSGVSNPLFISLFPDNSDDWAKEQAYQIYGKLPQLASVVHPMYSIYSTQIEIEEV